MRTYTPFLIASLGRSGTHLLGTSLASHSTVVWRFEAFNGGPPCPYCPEFSAAQVLDYGVFREHPEEVKAVGFSLLEGQGWGNVRGRLSAMPDLRVLLLRRTNLLRRYLSRHIAERTRRWHRWNPRTPPTSEQVTVDVDAVLADMTNADARYRAVREQFAACESIQIEYERLRDHRQVQLRRAQEFLGLEVEKLRPATLQQETRAVRDIVINYDELAARLAGTDWEAMLD